MMTSSFASKSLACLSMIALLSACVQPGQRGYSSGGAGIDKEMVGGIAGAAGGAVVGSKIGKGSGNIVAIAVGTLLGSYLGKEVGASLDRGDLAYYDRASQRALEKGQPGEVLPWENPNSTARGTITPQGYYQRDNGQYCREYTQTISVGGQSSQGYGTACRQPDGTWQIVSQ